MLNFNIMAVMLSLAGWIWISGCSSDAPENPDLPDTDASLYLKLQIDCAGSKFTRSNPTGGEDGDGPEGVQGREGDINSIDLLFYNSDSNDAINDYPESVIKHRVTLSGSELTELFTKPGDLRDGYYLIPLNGYEPVEGDRIFLFVNSAPEDIVAGVTHISALRDMKPSAAWTGDKVKECGNFSMATARMQYLSGPQQLMDGRIYFKVGSGDHTTDVTGYKDNPFYVYATVERTAARIDFHYPHAANRNDEIVYDVKTDDGTAVGSKVHVTHVKPVNMMTAPSYYFKRVTTSLTDFSFNYCHSEKPIAGIPANFVVEPTTSSKPGSAGFDSSTDMSAKLSEWFGTSATASVEGNAGAFTDGYSVGTLTTDGVTLKVDENGDLSESGGWDSLVIAYANENTMYGIATEDVRDFLTGLAFRGVYEPATVYAGYGRGEDGTETFTEDVVNDYAEGHTFWQFSETAQEMGEEKNLYFSNEEAALAYKDAHPEKNGIITKYDGGVCYYNLWIRHANTEADPHKPFEMEYAIVRNNIYRIGVEFSGPGTPTPEIREPDNIISRIFVRKWNFKCLEEVVL